LPSGWSASDIGAVGVPGVSSAQGGTFTVAGSGADVWGTADAFRYTYQSMTVTPDGRARRVFGAV
jgi:hypothetical protein